MKTYRFTVQAKATMYGYVEAENAKEAHKKIVEDEYGDIYDHTIGDWDLSTLELEEDK